MNRRHFLNSAVIGAGAAAVAAGDGGAVQTRYADNEPSLFSLDTKMASSPVPIFCAHEHWGSFEAIGMTAAGFRGDAQAGAEPARTVSIWDILLDPYFGGWLFAAGHDAHGLAVAAGYDNMRAWWHAQPEAALHSIEAALRAQHCTGAFQCIRQGIFLLHGADIIETQSERWQQADASIRTAYASIFEWYRQVMQKMNISEVVRPVHPEFFIDAAPRAAEERAIMHPILRIDPLLELWPESSERRDQLADALGIVPHDAASWRAFITALFDLAANRGNVGIKQLQAYTRPLDFVYRSDGDVKFSGPLSDGEKRTFQDWIVHECCKQAHERRWPHQIHTGTHNLGQSSPLPLGALAARYPNMNMVLLHCWPFIAESGFLAKHTPNIYLDACWQTVLNPAYLEEALTQWLGYLPATKVMCSQDATSIEMAAGSIAITRRILDRTLERCARSWQLPEASVCAYAANVLQNNAVRLYGVGTPCALC